MLNIYEAAAANRRKSNLILLLFIAFITVSVYFISQASAIYFGYQAGGLGIVGIALIISGLMSLGSYYFSDRVVLGISKAKKASRKKHFNFYTVSENLSIAAGLPKPRLYVIEDSAPNAFATGRDPKHAVICVTTGLLDKLSRTELEGVIAHELSHVKNYDIRLMSIVAVLVGMIALLGDIFLRMSLFGRGNSGRRKEGQMGVVILVVGIIFAILSPIIARLIRLAVSRRREFLADASAIAITRQPSGLISALEKISADHEPLEVANKATAHLYFENPFRHKRKGAIGWFSNLFNTHPPMLARVKALEKMV